MTTAVTGALLTLVQAAGARLKPIRDTMAPVTTGGMSRSIQLAPTRVTTRPIAARVAPAAIIPPWARDALAASRVPPPPDT